MCTTKVDKTILKVIFSMLSKRDEYNNKITIVILFFILFVPIGRAGHDTQKMYNRYNYNYTLFSYNRYNYNYF